MLLLGESESTNQSTDRPGATDLVLQAGLDRKRLVEEPLVKLLLGLGDHYDGHAPGVKLGAPGAAHHLGVAASENDTLVVGE